jgi:hypothetical protein
MSQADNKNLRLLRRLTSVRITSPHRCGQPGQQHGLRIPSLSSEHTLSTCCRLVSSFLTEMVQQIHSLRASGVMSSHAVRACTSDARAVRRSAGSSCTTPPEIRTVAIELSRQVLGFSFDRRILCVIEIEEILYCQFLVSTRFCGRY